MGGVLTDDVSLGVRSLTLQRGPTPPTDRRRTLTGPAISEEGSVMMSDGNYGAADLLSRLYLLLEAALRSPGDPAVVEVALVQAVAGSGADSAVLGTMTTDGNLDLMMMPSGCGPLRPAGALTVGPHNPLTDAVVREDSIWLSSPVEIRAAYPSAGLLWGRAFAAVPLMVRHKPVGVLGIIHDAAVHVFTASEREYLGAVASTCATVVAQHACTVGPYGAIPSVGHGGRS
ncbi:GAF domain-containing protein [Couchioplanes azureus]|uniref:GAF domain-containing protein n=1 Tax=Couchioplanes caeruleus TaxID=56438 RepID=UPI001670254D|nr:GAF domain-containing protein [Couchioplanes caeruleus]GGQ42891.1 hypothetical protein GCM10010166_08870 [Couchioplanes caeruleus subsp. azureus]